MSDTCSVEGCEKPTKARGWCGTHHERWRKRGTTVLPSRSPFCALPGCERPRHGQHCGMHAARLRRHGDADVVLQLGDGWVDAQGYKARYSEGHPLATGNAMFEQRVVLYQKLGPDDHPCHWCGRRLRWREDLRAARLDGGRENNAPDNLVPACAACILRRSRRVTTRGGTGMKEHVVPTPQASSQLQSATLSDSA